MTPIVVLDSSPLGLIVQRRDYAGAEECRQWVRSVLTRGARVLVPEIVVYELRRELLRLQKTKALSALSAFNRQLPDRLLPISSIALELAAELWAEVRRKGKPTAHPHALDVDAILAAQVLSAGFQPSDFIVATTNVSHLSQFVPAQDWRTI